MVATLQRPRIRELPPDIVDKIAAGEVVERPASVVKELVENSVDAGAKKIVVSVEDGGRKLIRILDDGWGIAQDELLLAVKSHATSKLANVEDLFAIRTLGFRGEALASIASISQFRIASTPPGALGGAELSVDGASVAGPRACGHPLGTTVEVRNIFFNVPARRAFLKGDRSELRAIENEVEKLALARFDVDVTLEHDGKTVLHAAPTDEPRERIAEILGRELAESLVAVEPRAGSAGKLRGYASPLDRSRGDARHQFFFINGRAVRDRVFLGAVRDAYANLLPPRRHPVVLLWLEVPPDEVDVNVHPTKAEVRFRRSSDIYGFIVSSLREAVARAGAPAPPLPLPRTGAPGFSSGSSSPSSAPWVPASVDESSGPRLVQSGRVFQIHRRYILEETDRGFRLIDPHALHERLLYDEIIERVAQRGLEVQRLLFPVVIDVDRAELSELEDRSPLLDAMGFSVSSFGPGRIAVHAAPRLIGPSALPELVRELLREPRAREAPDKDDALDAVAARAFGEVASRRKLVHGIAAALACKAAVKFGAVLSATEIETLLVRREEARAACCPHGRPTALSISVDELDRRFGR